MPEIKAAWQPELYGEIFSAIRKQHPQIILVATTSGRTSAEFEHRSAVLGLDGDAKPDMASLTLDSLNFPNQASVNAPDTIVRLLQRMQQQSIKPELEVFEMGMLNYAFYLVRKQLIQEPCYVNILLGSLGSSPARMQEVGLFSREIPTSWTWAAAGIGRYQLATNPLLVERIVRISHELGRSIATPAQARAMIGLAPR